MTEFQKQVYEIVEKIPRGQVLSYQEVAFKLNKPGAARAVGNALNRNFDRRIPCHRVIRSNGETGGYWGGLEMKIKILKKEGLAVISGKITRD